MKKFIALLISIFLVTTVSATNIQQFDRSNSITFEMVEDTRLQNSHVKNRYKYLYNLGLSYVDTPLVVKNQSNSQQLDTIVDNITSLHFGAAIYLKPNLQIAAGSAYSYFENNQNKKIHGFQDITLKLKYRLISRKLSAFTIMPIATIPTKAGTTETIDSNGASFGKVNLLSNNKFGLGIFAIYERLFKKMQMSLNLGYKINDGAEFKDNSGTVQIDKTQIIVTSLGVYIPTHKKLGINLEFIRNWTAPFINDDINPSEFFAGISSALTRQNVLFLGAGFGNLFSSSDGNDFRLVGGMKYTPNYGSYERKEIIQDNIENVNANYIIESDEEIKCKTPKLFGSTNSMTVLFDNNSHTLKSSQINKINKILNTVQGRFSEVNSVQIVGHTSTSASTKYNQELGQKRASAVKTLLVKAGVQSDIITWSSEGEILTLKKGDQELANKVNRRAEVLFDLKQRQNCY